jgi:hypothetical protein
MALSLNHQADLRVLRAEAQNAIAPFLHQALESLNLKHVEDERHGITRRHVQAIDEVQQMVYDSIDTIRERIGQ